MFPSLGSQARHLWREIVHVAKWERRWVWTTVVPVSKISCNEGNSSEQSSQQQLRRGKHPGCLPEEVLPQQGFYPQFASRTGAIGMFSSVSVSWRRSHSAEAREEGSKVELTEGDIYSMTRCFSQFDVDEYSKLSGDTNPIHSQVSAAKAAGLEGCVVHGMLYAGLFPAIIGSNFPGAVYVSQTLDFRKPVLVGETVVAHVEVTEKKKLRRQYKVTFTTTCHKGTVLVLKGTAVALLPLEMTTSV